MGDSSFEEDESSFYRKRSDQPPVEDNIDDELLSEEEEDNNDIALEDAENNNGNSRDTESSEDENEEVVPTIVRKRKLVSPVWNFAEKVGPSKARCTVIANGITCGVIVGCKDGCTSNLIHHIKIQHSGTPEAENLTKKISDSQAAKAKKREESQKLKSQPKITDFVQVKSYIDNRTKKRVDDALEDFIVGNNQPFELTENTFFRKLLFTANSGYIAPSRKTVTRIIDMKVEKVKEDLKKEIEKDIEEYKRVAVTSDGGRSHNKLKTKKNSVTVHRIDKDWVVKSDTIALPIAKGSQTGAVIRTAVLDALVKFGYNDSWKVLFTTDGDSAARSARAIGRHPGIVLNVVYEGDCVDHQLHLLVEESIEEVPDMQSTLRKVREFVTYPNQSGLAKGELLNIQKEINPNDKPLSPMMGTANRWYHKYKESERLLVLKSAIEIYDERNEHSNHNVSDIGVIDWELIEMYRTGVKPFESASTLLGGDTYPAACIVIPMIDQLHHDLEKTRRVVRPADGKQFVKNLLYNLEKRFPNCWRRKSPYNALCFLDPRNVDIYIRDDEDFVSVVETISSDPIYDDIRENELFNFEQRDDLYEDLRGPHGVQDQTGLGTTVVNDRRAELLRRKSSAVLSETVVPVTVRQKIELEANKFRKCTPIPLESNPLVWWSQNFATYPNLSRFMKANAAFQATTLSSERLFNKDKLLFGLSRQNIDDTRAEGLIVCHDYLNKRMVKDGYSLCKECPQPPGEGARYKITCRKHNV